MSLVTPQRLRAIYTMLCVMPPFNRWGLPEPKLLKFSVLTGDDHAEYSVDFKDRPEIAVNADTHLTLAQVIESVAHEMVHLRQDALERLPDRHERQHNAEFRKMARSVCQQLGFDVQRF